MIVYFSSAIPYEDFNQFLKDGDINGGHQAQKFNHLLIKGLALIDTVFAVSNPPYTCSRNIDGCILSEDNVVFYRVKGHKSRILHRINNFISLYQISKKQLSTRKEKVDYVICDSINVGAAFAALRLAKYLDVPAVSIVTDIPEIICNGKMSLFARIDSFLMKRFDSYVLLTESMNEIVNPHHKPYIVVEGSCEVIDITAKDEFSHYGGKKICLYTGSICQGIGLEKLIRAFKKGNFKDAELHIYGSGVWAEQMKELIGSCGPVRYCGMATNKETVWSQQKADLLINPRPSGIHYGEYSFPSKIIEYLASGTPTLSTRLPGIPTEYQPYLYWIEDESDDGFIKALDLCLSAEASVLREMGQLARKFVSMRKTSKIQCQRMHYFIMKTKGNNKSD